MREILVAVTFREFDGDVNSRIQEAFLEGLKNQTYGNFKLIVTNYRERFVDKELEKAGMPFAFHQSTRDCRFSWSEVVANTFPHLRPEGSIILWTNADVIFDSNYFAEIVKNFQSGIGGTSHPPLHYYTLEDFHQNRLVDPYYGKRITSFYEYDPNIFIPETMYIDGDLMLDTRNRQLFSEHMMEGPSPGAAVTLMFGFFASRIINLVYESKVSSIQNKKQSDHSQDRLFEKNEAIMLDFCRSRALHRKYYTSSWLRTRKLNIHGAYHVVGSLWQRFLFAVYLLYYTIRPRGSFLVTVPRLRKLAARLLHL